MLPDGLEPGAGSVGQSRDREVLAAPSVATFTVDSTLDAPDDNINDGLCHTDPFGPALGKCTLRAAVMQANVVSVDTTIIVPAGAYTLAIPPVGPDGPETGDLNLTTPSSGFPVISIVGAGAASTLIDGNGTDRVFNIAANRTASISGVTIRHGDSPASSGGGIYNNGGTLTLNNSMLSGNSASNAGGGISSNGTLTLIASTLSGNLASLGGGIYTIGTATLNNSTLRGNSASYGGGISNFGTATLNNSTLSGNWASTGGGGIYNNGTARLNRSTLSGNPASTDGGGIYNGSTLFLVNSTLSQNNAVRNGGGLYNGGGTASVYNASIIFNSADADPNSSGSGGGVYNDDTNGAVFKLGNTLLAGNYSYDLRTDDDCTGTLQVYGNNLFGTNAGCSIDSGSGFWDLLNLIDLIGPLKNNGGPTLTHALLAGSNAIDAGGTLPGCVDQNGVLLATDQRGWARVGGLTCDIGALEYGLPLYLRLVVR